MPQTKPTLALVCLFVSGIITANAQSQKVVADKIVTVVGDRIILYSDLKNAVADATRLNDGKISQDALCDITEQALISKVLMLQAEKDSLVVADEEVEAELDQRIRYFARTLGGIEALEKYAGKTIYQLKDDSRPAVRERHLATNMQRKILSSVRITPAEVKTFFEKLPHDSLPFLESELEIGSISIYPKLSPELEAYTVSELNNYKRQIESKAVSFEQLGQRFSERCGEEEKDRGLQYVLSRNDQGADAKFMTAVFKMLNGQLSAPVKTPTGYYLVQLLQKNGDEAIVRHIFRRVPVSDAEIGFAKNRMDSIKAALYAGKLGFRQAARKFDESRNAKNGEFFLLNAQGTPLVTVDQLDKETALALTQIQQGDYSVPFITKDEDERTVVKMIYLQSRTQPHVMNLKDDYDRIAEAALNEKRAQVMSKWVREKMLAYAIEVDPEIAAFCGNLPVKVSRAGF